MKKRLFLSYLNSKKSWLIFFFLASILVNFIIIIDEGINVERQALLYLNSLLVISFIIFFIWRYFTEIAYLKNLIEISGNPNLSKDLLPVPTNRLEEINDQLLKEILSQHEDLLKATLTENQLENDYIAAWIHEVKTPLTAMKLMIEEERHNPTVKKIESEWLRIHLLLDQQLSMTRFATLAKDYLPEKVSLLKMVNDEVKQLATWCFEKQLAVEIEGDDTEVLTDEKWCRFVIRQILTNAIKYSNVGSVIEITFTINESNNKIMTIKDNGHGIAAHDLPRIFEKGFTGTTGRINNAATGLGLYIANDVAEQLKIKLQAQSNLGEGTTLIMTFPVENDFDNLSM